MHAYEKNPHNETRSLGTWLLLSLLALLSGCENRDTPPGAKQEHSWIHTAIVADLSYRNPDDTGAPDLAELKTIGFDTVLFDSTDVPPRLLKLWVEAAKSQPLRILIRIGFPGPPPSGSPGEMFVRQGEVLTQADGLIIMVEHTADLDYARALRTEIEKANPGTALIAQVSGSRPSDSQMPSSAVSSGLFEAILTDSASADLNALLNFEGTSPQIKSADAKPDAADQDDHGSVAQWRLLPHCSQADGHRCSEDIRLLVMGFMQSPVPVIGVIEAPYWQDMYASLIRLRKEHDLIRDGKMEWYAADDEAAVVAFRLSNEKRQHILVAVNVSNDHQELPLPSGFMADSKIKLWASYDPRIREFVTSKPVVLPARSAAVVIYD